MRSRKIRKLDREFIKKSRNQPSKVIKHKVKKSNKSKKNKRTIYKKNRRKLKSKRKESGNNIRDLLISCAIVLVVLAIAFYIFFGFTKVKGYNMSPTLTNGNILFYKKTSKVKRFDLVVINNGGSKQVRRVIGLPGESLEYKDDTLYINGKQIDEKFIIDEINEAQKNGGQYIENFSLFSLIKRNDIPSNQYVVLGDNRPYATDSRFYGLIDSDNIIGVVLIRVLPIDEFEVF